MGKVIDKASYFLILQCRHSAEQSLHREMRERIDDAIRRVTAAGERRRERERVEREKAERERIAQVLHERRERLCAPTTPIDGVEGERQ